MHLFYGQLKLLIMKPAIFSNSKLILAILAVSITAGLVSWYPHSQNRFEQPFSDTVPKKSMEKEKKIRDLDEALEEMEKAGIQLDAAKMQKEIAGAMNNIDVEKMKMQVEKALQQVDMAKMQHEVETSLAKVDWEKMKGEMANAMNEVDIKKIQQEVKASLQKIDWDKMKAEIEKVKDIDMSKMKMEMDKMKVGLTKIKPEIEKAKIKMEMAKTEIKEYKAFVDGLENDGLINKKEGYSLKHKDGLLEINGKKVSEQVNSKYRLFLEKHKTFTIRKDGDNFYIDMDKEK